MVWKVAKHLDDEVEGTLDFELADHGSVQNRSVLPQSDFNTLVTPETGGVIVANVKPDTTRPSHWTNEAERRCIFATDTGAVIEPAHD